MSNPPPPTCRHCDRPLVEPETVRLWDGRDYCRDCVEAEMPGLAEYAATHPRLVETAPREPFRELQMQLRNVLLFLIALKIIAVSGAFIDGGPPRNLLMQLDLGTMIAMFIAMAAMAPAIALILWNTGRGAVVADGVLQCWRRGRPRRSFQLELRRSSYLHEWHLDREAPIDRLHWRTGPATKDLRFRGAYSIRVDHDVVLLEFPAGFPRLVPFSTYLVPCDWTEETRERWLAFLRLAGVPRLDQEDGGSRIDGGRRTLAVARIYDRATSNSNAIFERDPARTDMRFPMLRAVAVTFAATVVLPIALAHSVIEYELPATLAGERGGVSPPVGSTTSSTTSSPTSRLTPAARRELDNAVAGLDVAEGLEVSLFAGEPMLLNPTNIDIDHRGRVWVCEVVNYRGKNGTRPEGDRILILEDTDGDGQADKRTVYYQGRDIDSAMGICVLGNKVIVSCSPNVFVFTDEDGDDKPDKKELLFTKTGAAQHDHSAHAFVFGP
ncbi:MAG: PVC-type heme-binding CxxCH protein, partial [Planctomycetaceae bacterium]